MLTHFGVTVVFAVGLCIIGAMLYDWLRKQRTNSLLRSRPQLDAAEFGAKYFGESADRTDTAARVHRVLAKNLGLDLDGLEPEDRLNEDLHADLPSNPLLFMQLEAEFAQNPSDEPFADEEEADSTAAEQIQTVRDLIEFIDGKRKADGAGGANPQTFTSAD